MRTAIDAFAVVGIFTVLVAVVAGVILGQDMYQINKRIKRGSSNAR